MAFLDIFRKKSGNKAQQEELNNVVDTVIGEAAGKKINSWANTTVNTLDTCKALSTKDDNYLKALILVAMERLNDPSLRKAQWAYNTEDSHSYWTISALISYLVGRPITFTDEELYKLTKSFSDNFTKTDYYSGIPFKQLVAKIEANIRTGGLNTALSNALELLLVEDDSPYTYSDRRKNNEYIRYLLQGSTEVSPDSSDELGQLIIAFLAGIEEPELKKAWSDLVAALILGGNKTNPSDKWVKETKALMTAVGKDAYIVQCTHWLELCLGILKEIHKVGFEGRRTYLQEVNHDLLKSAIWLAGTLNDAALTNLLDEYGLMAYKKMPGVGAISVRTGNACLYAFSILPFREGISRLTKFRMKIKYPSVLRVVDKYITQVAKKEGYSQERLEELAVPDFGLVDGQLRKTLGEHIAVVAVKGINSVSISWEHNGKMQASVPAKVKEAYKTELAAFRKLVKEIETALPVQRDRVEQFYIRSRTWSFSEWKASYMLHPLMAIISKDLIWHFSENDHKAQAMISGTEPRDVDDQPLDWITDATQVQLWHPIGFAAENVLKWRERLETMQIRQPFKQAYREVYIITDAELNTETYSNRFAAHILRQHQFAALCKQRGWHYTLMGNWDSHNTPYLDLPLWDMRVQYFVDSDWNTDAINGSGIFNYISTDQVRFFKAGQQIPISDVPAMVFTEVMRDVDLFVGVTSIGNDPNWGDTGNQQMNMYWRDYSFSELTELAKIREQVLKRLIPRLKIANVCAFDGKFLLVKGKLRNYKIHIGSGNILMQPNDQYLCIVPSRAPKEADKLFLPFEGDNMLSIIISKALLLADDDKITDTTITSQINRA